MTLRPPLSAWRFATALTGVALICGLAVAFGWKSEPIVRPLSGPPPRIWPARSFTPNPDADAAAAAKADDFRLFVVSQYGNDGYTPGVTCFTPAGQPPETLVNIGVGDAPNAEQRGREAYARAYNLALVERADYPDADLCRLPVWQERINRDSSLLVATPARVATTPVRSLHEAARRGSLHDIRTFLAKTPVDSFDGFGMTPLAWAAARGRGDAVDLLLANGEDAWAGTDRGFSALYWAAAMGRQAIFDTLRKASSRFRHVQWTSAYVAAAAISGNRAIVEIMLREPHEPMQPLPPWSTLPPATSLEPALRERPRGLADSVLIRALADAENGHLDIIALALRYGADPNAISVSNLSNGTALELAAGRCGKQAQPAIALLLKAGGDPNLASTYGALRSNGPLWSAVQTISYSRAGDAECVARAKAIVEQLIAAGARLDLANARGRPPIWFLFTIGERSSTEITAPSPVVQFLPTLVRLGLDPNARWKGATLLPLVERMEGKNSELALMLRSLGAH